MATPLREPITAFRGPHRFLSNFWPVTICYEGVSYPSVEHAYQAAKASSRADRMSISLLPTAGDAKRAGRRVAIRPDWEKIKHAVMLELLRAKFAHKTLRAQLLATGDTDLIEGNTWGDRHWGQCPLGTGENWLGRLLMRVRDELR